SGGNGLRRGGQGGGVGGVARGGLGRGQGGGGERRRARGECQDHLHWLRHRARLQDRDGGAEGLEGHARESLLQAFHRRLALRRDLARAARRRLHHRSQ